MFRVAPIMTSTRYYSLEATPHHSVLNVLSAQSMGLLTCLSLGLRASLTQGLNVGRWSRVIIFIGAYRCTLTQMTGSTHRQCKQIIRALSHNFVGRTLLECFCVIKILGLRVNTKKDTLVCRGSCVQRIESPQELQPACPRKGFVIYSK